jgi:hypothetical protein
MCVEGCRQDRHRTNKEQTNIYLNPNHDYHVRRLEGCYCRDGPSLMSNLPTDWEISPKADALKSFSFAALEH